jgi:pimeloyl-ACP methyl ester carboxylesterase
VRTVAAGVTLATLLVAGLLWAPSGLARAHGQARFDHNAVIFVHGFEGSGGQFESQKLRLTSNGYPDRYVVVFEYDSLKFAGGLSGGSIAAEEKPLFARMDRLIARMKKVTHRRQVDLLAHSLGTRLMQDYLGSSKKRAARVGHYVNLDGFPESSLPGGVRTLALWGTKGPISAPGRKIVGAKNINVPDSSHVQTATSAFSFKRFYRFFTGHRPKTTEVVPQHGRITLSGRALNFPQNSALSGAMVQMWKINQSSGQRIGKHPIKSFVVGSTGHWGPAVGRAGQRYEFALVRPEEPIHHFYYQPFLRSDHLIRLLESDALRSAGGPPSAQGVSMVIVRYKEIWGDQRGQNDVLKVDGANASNATTCPLSREVNALFVADFNHDGKSEPTQTWPPYEKVSQYFLSSSDVFAPAHSPASGKVTVSIQDRGHGPTRSLTFPNWPGTSDDVTVQLNDFDQP